MEQQAEPSGGNSSFKTRVRSALVLAPIVLGVIWYGHAPFALLMAVAAGIAAFEWTKMLLTGQENAPEHLPLVAASITGLSVVTAAMMGSPLGSLIFLAALMFALFAYNFSKSGPSVRDVMLGLFYIGFAMQVMVWLRLGTDHGLYHLLTLLFLIWASDSFAYFTGRAIGGPKLAPKISPKKTWAGFWGSSFGAGLVCAGMACPWMVEKLGVKTLGGMGSIGYFAAGFVLAMFGQAGDLLISIFKRHYGVKDTGHIIPGHGGILDRIDALLLVGLLFGALAVLMGA